MISTRYQSLFKITLQHDYYGDGVFDDLVIVPSEETTRQFSNYKILCRIYGNVLTAFIQTENDQPFISLNNGLVFRFFVSVKNTAFINFSALKMSGTEAGIYYFSNKSNNKKNNHCYLSAPVPIYNNTASYEMGTVVKKNSRVFECLKANSVANKHDVTDTDYWRDIVIHLAGLLPLYSDTQNYQPGVVVKLGQKVFECLQANSVADKHNTTEAAYWQEITELAYINNDDLLNASTINGETIPPKIFAVIDIFNGSGESADFTLLTPTGEVRATDFLLRFKNRSSTWKYISQKKAVTAISDVNGVYSFSNAVVGNEFVSQAPIPFSRSPLTSIKMNAVINNRPLEITGLQNPTADMISPAGSSDEYNLFSEIYLNY